MDPTTHQTIHDILAKLLNREPTENEIQNGQTDQYVIQQMILQKLGISSTQ